MPKPSLQQARARAAQDARKYSPRRKRLARHLHACGPRPVLDALEQVARGRPLDEVLRTWADVPPGLCQAVGARDWPRDEFPVIRGGRS